eukprot:CAMPEP_0167833716 /NCGR_PEP_ID=MMETSP0112_2-20121227/15198_1 /TAXON_ID=91324 /ORGANISM="Lotharella globosa, Strain CCCM811" /LENGTH=73 /DNA_ID=CAMNT_0007739209 /DNA_START=175 /DNA_END=396 /DNA_ORIENTATION=-
MPAFSNAFRRPLSRAFQSVARKEILRAPVTQTDSGNAYKSFLQKTNAVMRQQSQLPRKQEHMEKFLQMGRHRL